LKKKKQTFLWKIRHAESDTLSYLFGTMHVRDKRAFGALPVAEEKIEECAAFATEFNFEDADATQMNGQMQLSDNHTLKDLFKPKKYKKIATFLEKQTGMDIETFAEQMAIMEKITLEQQAKILYQTVKDFKNYRKQLKKLTDLYQSGKLQQLNKSARKGMGSLRKLLVDDRNYIMADRIAKMTVEQSTFIAIGAGHLGGKSGVLRLLKLKGMKVAPIH